MGCVQTKHSNSESNSLSRGVDMLKQQNGYVGKGGFEGERDIRKESGRHEYRLDSRRYKNAAAYGGIEDGGSVVDRREERDVGGNFWKKEMELKPNIEAVELVYGWPKWLTDNVPREVLSGLVAKTADSYVMLSKLGEGTYSNVYKARDKDTNKVVALKKVRFDTSEPDSVKFMAREIVMLQKLDHPNIIKLEGLATSRMQYSIYLVFDFMVTDLATIMHRREERLTEPQIKCYMHQLLSGLQHCHDKGILHRDLKGPNILIDKNGVLKIADFGLANYYRHNHSLTNRVVTLWYRAPELLLGATNYGVGIDLWSAGCLLAEMLLGRPILPARTEVEQVDMIFKLCGTPSEKYWEKLGLPRKFKPPKYRPSLGKAFGEFPASSKVLLKTLLALDPEYRGCASSALQSEFFYTSPLPCNLSDLPVVYSKDDELKEADEERKYRKSRMKQRFRTHRERQGQDLATEKPKEDSEFSKKETAEPTVQSQEPIRTMSSTSSFEKQASRTESPPFTTSSNSSGVKPSSQTESPPFLLCPDLSSNQRMSPRTLDHPNATKNIKNLPPSPIPTSRTRIANYDKDNDMYRLNSVHRSASTRDFRRTSLRNQFDVHAYGDY